MDHETFLNQWMKEAAGFWSSLARMWPESGGAADAAEAGARTGAGGERREHREDPWESHRKLWESLFAAATPPGTAAAGWGTGSFIPQLLSQLAGSAWQHYFDLYRTWLENAEQPGMGFEPPELEPGAWARNAAGLWREAAVTELRRLLNMPQMGPMRGGQEKINRTLDRFVALLSASTEMAELMGRPFEQALRDAYRWVSEATRKGEPARDFKQCYRQWMDTLESRFHELLKSPEFVRALGETTTALAEFVAARNELLSDALAGLPVATHRDLDELYRELYELRKEVRKLSRKLAERPDSP